MKNVLKYLVVCLTLCLMSTVNYSLAGCTTPGVPTGLTATVDASDCSVTFNWTEGSNTVDSEITVCTDAAFTANCVVLPNETPPLTLTGFDPSTTYYYRVRDRNTGGAFQCFSAYVGSSFASGACTPSPDCGSCAQSCGTCGFTLAPTVQQVVDNCDHYGYFPAITSGQSDTRCHQFQAIATSVDFNVIISSTCGGGNVSAFSWTLQSNSCGAILQSGNLGDLTFDALTIGNFYTFCYTFTVPNPAPVGCSHSFHAPFFVGANSVILPLELKSFNGLNLDNINHLIWTTSSERENDYFTLERMDQNMEWEKIGTVKGAGNSTIENDYEFKDDAHSNEINYYRLSQTDFNGTTQVLKTITIDNSKDSNFKLYNLLGQEVDDNHKGLVIVKFSDNQVIKIFR